LKWLVVIPALMWMAKGGFNNYYVLKVSNNLEVLCFFRIFAEESMYNG
jgi:hypothetical protein